MNLVELYSQTPVSQHGNILVAGDRIYVRSAEGTDEYLLELDGYIGLIRSERDIRQELERIRAKLGA